MIESFLNTVAQLKEELQFGIQFDSLAQDVPDDRDLLAGDPKIRRLPEEVHLDRMAQKWGFTLRKQSKGSCTAYSEIFRAEIENTIRNERKILLDPELQWKYQEKTGASRSRGDWIQNAKKQFHKHPQGYPQTEWRRLTGNHDSAKKWLATHRPINTGVYWKWLPDQRMSNFKYMKKTGIFVPGVGDRLGGHAILLTGFKDGFFEFIESELAENKTGKNQNGKFVMHENHFYELMSCYISMDALDS